jgi:hypothetical protein
VDGQSFAPYSAGYAKQRVKSGRNASPPTLLLTGAMLGSMKVLQSDQHKAVIGFSGSSARVKFAKRKTALRFRGELTASAWGKKGRNRYAKGAVKATHSVSETSQQVANALKAAWNDRGEGKTPRRRFFGLSPEDRRALMRDALQQVIAAVREASFTRLTRADALREARLKK